MQNYDESVKINCNPNWPCIHDHLYNILMIGGSRSGKTNVLLNIIKHQQPDIDKIYLYIKGPIKSKCQFLINGREKVGIKIAKKSEGIHWLLTSNWWCLWKFRRLESNKEKKSVIKNDMIEDLDAKKN